MGSLNRNKKKRFKSHSNIEEIFGAQFGGAFYSIRPDKQTKHTHTTEQHMLVQDVMDAQFRGLSAQHNYASFVL